MVVSGVPDILPEQSNTRTVSLTEASSSVKTAAPSEKISSSFVILKP